jgi:hypothetical protein
MTGVVLRGASTWSGPGALCAGAAAEGDGSALPTRTGPSCGALSEAPHGDRHESHERLEDQGTEGDESREGDEHRDPQQSVHAAFIGVATRRGAEPVGVISVVAKAC